MAEKTMQLAVAVAAAPAGNSRRRRSIGQSLDRLVFPARAAPAAGAGST